MPITITLPDGSQRQYDAGVTGFEVATDLGPRDAYNQLGALLGDLRSGLCHDPDDAWPEDRPLS